MWLWAGVAFALECSEITHMADAGVPIPAIVERMNAAGPAIDDPTWACLRDRHLDPGLLDAANRLRTTRPPRPKALTERWDALPTGRLTVDLECGSLHVRGQDATRIVLQGRADEGARVAVTASDTGLELQIVDHDGGDDPAALPRFTPRSPARTTAEPPCADLELEVPRGTRLLVRSTRADLDVRFVEGALELTSHFGRVDVVGDTAELSVRTTGGDVHADTGARHVDIQTVGGLVEVGAGAEARLNVTSISGPLWIWGGPLRRLRAETVSGDIHLRAAMLPQAHAEIVTHKGRIEVEAPPGQVALASHGGQTSGPPRMIRPDGPSSRGVAQPRLAPARFPSVDRLPLDTAGLWGEGTPTRWWFESGAVISHVVRTGETDFTLEASSFSGDVHARVAESFPGPTGPVIARLDQVADRMSSCARAQSVRHPGVRGHAVATLAIDPDGVVRRVSAPATAADPRAVADGQMSSCVVRALDGLSFPPGGEVEVRWPVVFPPFDAPGTGPSLQPRPVVEVLGEP